jgi:NhaA family Na+:H+ antiporter
MASKPRPREPRINRLLRTIRVSFTRRVLKYRNSVDNPPPVIGILMEPFQQFISISASGGILLILTTLAAVVWANSPWHEAYHHLWEFHLGLSTETTVFNKTLHFWINDGLMAIFFLLVGLEIKREVRDGELSSIQHASLPVVAAVGGMLIPAGLFAVLHIGQEGLNGWGVPMATDIAFSLGILQLLGNRVPVSLKVFLTAFAIVDDIGAVLVIAFFYSESLAWGALAIAGGLLVLLMILNRLNVRDLSFYLIIGVFIWYFFYKAGIHPTVAGVAVALTIPANPKINIRGFADRVSRIMKEFRDDSKRMTLSKPQLNALDYLQDVTFRVQSPLQNLENKLNGWVTYLIMPLFAFANAGVTIKGALGENLVQPIALNIAIALLVGKFIGISGFSWLGVRLGIASLPVGIRWKQLFALSLFGGVGFTMSLFISNLAFTNDQLLDYSKVGILLGSFLASVLGLFFMSMTTPKEAAPAVAVPRVEDVELQQSGKTQ